MRKILFFILLFLWNCSGGGGSSPTETEGGNDNGDNTFIHNDIDGYEVVFFDYFSGPLDMTKWNDSPWWGREHSGNGSVMYYAPVTDEEGPRVEGCCLKIPVDRLPDQSVLPIPYNDPSSWPGVLDYTSGSINTHMKFNFTYGIVKFRAKAAKEKGIWPGVWMVPPQPYTKTHNTWGPEFDILEMSHLHNDQPNLMGGYIYWSDKDNGAPHFAFNEIPGNEELMLNYTESWHDYEMHWSKDAIRFYMDDHLLLEITEDDFPDSEPPHSAWIADVPMYLMINVAVGASWMEDDAMPDENTQFPIDDALMVDYIKVYQKID